MGGKYIKLLKMNFDKKDCMLLGLTNHIRKSLLNIYIDYKIRNLNFVNKNVWKKAFLYYFMESLYGYDTPKDKIKKNKRLLLEGFTSRNIKIVKRGNKKNTKKDKDEMPILVSVVKDELEILPMFFFHYRKLGIKKFVIIDNMSSDGTLEYLKKQIDTDVYTVKEKFKGFVKEGWINRILALYGFNRWYIVVDADELLVWPHMEKESLKNMINVLQERNLYRPLAVMLDMYSKDCLYQKHIEDVNSEFCYCDKNTYYWLENPVVDILSGGPRERKLNCKVWLSKSPLFYLRPMELLCCAHYLYPYQKFDNAKCSVALLHYKFAYENSFNKMKKYIKNGIDKNRAGESIIYTKSRKLKFYYKDSACLDDMENLCEIECISGEL